MDVAKRFFSASDARVERAAAAGDDIDENTAHSMRVNDAVRSLAEVIKNEVPEGRQKSIALTDLESVQMRSNRGIFSNDPQR